MADGSANDRTDDDDDTPSPSTGERTDAVDRSDGGDHASLDDAAADDLSIDDDGGQDGRSVTDEYVQDGELSVESDPREDGDPGDAVESSLDDESETVAAADDESDAAAAAGGETVARESGETVAGESGETVAEESAEAVAQESAETVAQESAEAVSSDGEPRMDLPPDVRKYDRFKKIDGGTYDRANEFLRERTYVTAREWAIARLCADFRTETGVEMTKIGENLPELVPFMTDTYTPQAVNQARASFEEKVRKAGATFLYGAMCDFFTAEELDDVMYEATEVAKFLLEVEGVELTVEEELAAEDQISDIMREVREHSAALRHDEIECPDCGHHFEATAADAVDSDE